MATPSNSGLRKSTDPGSSTKLVVSVIDADADEVKSEGKSELGIATGRPNVESQALASGPAPGAVLARKRASKRSKRAVKSNGLEFVEEDE